MWRQILRQNFTQLDKLADFLELSEEQRSQLILRKNFPLNLPYRLAEKINKQRLDDPIFKQFVPTKAENQSNLNFIEDPLQEQQCKKSSKLLHKYEGRALLVVTSACAMHCRYCFRQHFDYETERKDYEEELNILKSDSSIKEIILSGGDPLSLTNERLESLLDELSRISHIKRIRIHTRFPIGIPERIDDEFCNILARVPQKIWIIIHTNHPRELDQDVFSSLNKLQRLGIVIQNQAVLLKGVNDNVDTLQELSEKLVDHGILPYYLHQLDKVTNTAQFEVPVEKGKRLMKQLQSKVSGYALPRYAVEEAGEASKTWIAF